MDYENPIVTIQMATGEVVKLVLFPDIAPNTVSSFIDLANRGKYNGKKILRIVKGYLIQPNYHYFDDNECNYFIELEFKKEGHSYALPLDKWVVAMAVDGKGLASGSEFFFSMGDNKEQLNGIVPGFGKVIEGFEVLDRIENVETCIIDIGIPGISINEPICPEIIESISIDTFGFNYSKPIIKEAKNV